MSGLGTRFIWKLCCWWDEGHAERGMSHQKEPFLLQLVKDDFKYLWRYWIGLLFPAINIELGQPVKVLKT